MKFKMVFACVAITATTSYILSSCSHKPATTRKDVTYAPPPNLSREPSSNKEDTPWTQWTNKSTLGGLLELSKIRKSLFTNNLHDPHISYKGYNKQVDCSKTETRFRSADGTCTDIGYPMSGAAGTAFGRNVKPEDIDHNAAEKLMIPNPDTVSKEFFTRDKFKEVGFLNMLAASWIQFMNHDWFTHGPNMKGNEYTFRSEDGNREHVVDRTKQISADLSQFKKEFGRVNANDVTHWWDGSQIYGSSQEEQSALRTFSNGKMKTAVVNNREILPKGNLNPANNRQNQGYELTGFRDNWWIGLSMLHTLFVKEHNAIADELMKNNVRHNKKKGVYIWKNGSDQRELTAAQLDNEIFQTARMINAAVMAKIHTVEWTPAILPNEVLHYGMNANWNGILNPASYDGRLAKLLQKVGLNKADLFKRVDFGSVAGGIVGGKYDRGVAPYSLTEEFTSVYRLHPLLPEQINIKSLANKNSVRAVPFIETRNHMSYDIMANTDLKDLFYSFGTQHPGQLVTNNTPNFMQSLEIPGHPKIDLAMIDILRDRERGVPRYNQFRKSIGLKPITTYKDFFKITTNNGQLTDEQVEKLNKFYRVYGRKADGTDNVDDIDVLVGAYAEEVRPDNFGFGETQFQIFILMATRRLLADRFFTVDYNANHYTRTGMKWIDKVTMSSVILRHMPELAPKLKGVETAFNPWNN